MESGLIGKIVSCETPEYIKVLYPSFIFESRVDPVIEINSIYIGRISPKAKSLLLNRGFPFVIWNKSGGEVHLDREGLFSMCIKRKRKYKEILDSISETQFINCMRILRITDTYQQEEEEESLYPIFGKISSGSKESLKMVYSLLKTKNPHQVLASLITFYGRVINIAPDDDIGKSANYTALLKRAARRKQMFMKGVLALESTVSVPPTLQITSLIMSVCK